MRIHIARSKGEDSVETTREVMSQILGPDFKGTDFTMQGIRVFETGTEEDTLKREEMTVYDQNNVFAEKKEVSK